jgi:hypothetical protein
VDVEWLFETLPDDDLVEEAQFVLNNGKVASKTELVDLIADDETRRQVAARILGVQSDDPDLRVRLLQALDTIEDQLRAEPRWIEDVPEPEPVVTHDLEAVTVMRNGVQSEISAAEMEQMVEAACRRAAVWTPDEDGVQFETDVPWSSWVIEEQARSCHSPFVDDRAWPKAVSPLWADLLNSWQAAGVASDVLDALMGGEIEIPDTALWAVKEMEGLADVLADEPEGSTQTVARALAYRLAKMGVEVKREDGQLPAEALYEQICWALGVDGTRGWDSELPTADSLRRAVAAWVGKVAKAKGVWKSQAAAIRALVLERADPRAARAAARAAFSGA